MAASANFKVRWSLELEDQLVELWQTHECLYNVSSKSYHNRNDKNRSWQEIATAIDVSVEDVRARATSLRTQYSKLLKSQPSGGGEKGLTSKQKWMLKSLFFLKPHVVQRASETSLHTSGKEEPISDVADDTSEMSELPEEELSSGSQCRAATPHSPEPPKKKAKKSADSIELEKLKVLQDMSTTIQANRNRPVQDSDGSFGVQVAAELRLITNPRLKSRVKARIMDALYEAQEAEHHPLSTVGLVVEMTAAKLAPVISSRTTPSNVPQQRAGQREREGEAGGQGVNEMEREGVQDRESEGEWADWQRPIESVGEMVGVSRQSVGERAGVLREQAYGGAMGGKRRVGREDVIGNFEANMILAMGKTAALDADEQFLLSLLPALRRLDIKQRATVKLEMHTLVYKAEFP